MMMRVKVSEGAGLLEKQQSAYSTGIKLGQK